MKMRTGTSLLQPADGEMLVCERCGENRVTVDKDKMWFITETGRILCEDCVKKADKKDREIYGH